MQGKVIIISGEAAKGVIGKLEEISNQNIQLLADNKKFEASDEEFRQKLAEPRTITEKIKSWWGRS